MTRLGVDTLCWHARLEHGDATIEEILEIAADLGCEAVSIGLHHVRRRDLAALEALGRRAADRGLAVVAIGDFVGRAREGDTAAAGAESVRRWLERAAALGSPWLRVASGFYRADLADRPDLIEAERRLVVDVLARTAGDAADLGILPLLENHSDFTAAEYRSIIDETGPGRVGVFLDLINPISAFDDPIATIEQLAPLAPAGHVKDYRLSSIAAEDDHHRSGFAVRWCYPGEGVAPLPALLAALARGGGSDDVVLTVEGLDNRSDIDDQVPRLRASLALLRTLMAGSPV